MAPEDTTELYLGLIEADKIQSYIMRSGKLKDIVGASSIIDKFNHEEVYQYLARLSIQGNLSNQNGKYKINKKNIFNDNSLDYQLIYSGGGNVKILFTNKENAENVCRSLTNTYRRMTISADATWVVHEFSSNDDINKIISKAELNIRSKKAAKNVPTQPLTSPYFRTCVSCGVEPAAVENNGEFICRTCYEKRKVGSRPVSIFEDFHKELTDCLAEQLNKWKTYCDGKDDIVFKEDSILPSNFNSLADSRNYIGIVVIDGNQFGKIIQALLEDDKTENNSLQANIAKLSEFSKTVDKLVTLSLVESVSAAFTADLSQLPSPNNNRFIREVESDDGGRNNQKRFYLPFRPIIIGGDDLTFVCAADNAVSIAVGFVEKFNKLSREKPELFGENGATCGIGITIVKKNFPFNTAYNLAEELLNNSKVKWRQFKSRNADNVASAIDYSVITASSIDDLKSKRRRELLYKVNNKKYFLTGKPYLIAHKDDLLQKEDFSELLKTAAEIKNQLGSGKFKSLRQIVRNGKLNSQYQYSKLVYRLSPEKKEKINNLLEKYGGLWREDEYENERVLVNNFLDMIEIYPYIKDSLGD